MRILMVNNLYPPQVIGGAEIVMRRHALALRARGHEVAVLAGWLPGYPGEQLPEMDSLDGLSVYRFPFRSWDQGSDFHVPLIEPFLDRVIEAGKPDVLHVHNARGLGANIVAAGRRRGLRVVVTLHDYWWHCHWATLMRPDGRLCRQPYDCGLACARGVRSGEAGPLLPLRLRRDALMRRLDLADAVIAPGAWLASAYQAAGLPGGRVTVVSNGIDLDAIEPRTPADGPVRFIAVLSLAEHKGVPDLLEAAALLHAKAGLRGRWTLAIAGDGQLAGTVAAAIADGRVGPSVVMLGALPRSEILQHYARSDVVVLPSRWPENEPVVLLEGAAAGLAQIATDIGGSPALVEAGRTGFLVPARDPAALARAMEAYIGDPALLARHAARNVGRRQAFDERHSIDRLERLYAGPGGGSGEVDFPLVVCGGAPSPEIAALVDRLHALGAARLRLLWHEHALPEDWHAAAFFWHWGGDYRACDRAALEGVPILAPRGAPGGGRTVCYDSLLEAAAALELVAGGQPGLGPLRRVAGAPIREAWRAAGPLPWTAAEEAIRIFEAALRDRARALGLPRDEMPE